MGNIETKELMLGDWLSNNGTKFQVYAIGQHSVSFKDEKEGDCIAHQNFIEPIPLTKEILERNGFGYCESDAVLNHFYLGEPHFCKNMSLHIGHSIDKDVYWLNYHDNSIYGIWYVHQLQHALRMCGLNMEVQL